MADETEGQQQETQAAQFAEGVPQLEELIATTAGSPQEEGYELVSTGIREFVRRMLGKPGVKVNAALLTEFVADLDKKLSLQVDEILHHPDVQKLESAWRGLFFMIDRTNFKENIKLEFVNVTKDDLLTDSRTSPR